jgi:hypothetical protein
VNPRLRNGLLFGSACALMLVIASYLYWDEQQAAPPPGHPPEAMRMQHSTPVNVRPGIRQPKTLPASEAHLVDSALVIGVTAAGKYRAYALVAFTLSRTQVVNDLIEDVPVTVTYARKPKRHRVFTADQRGAPLDVWQANVGGGEDIVLRIGDVSYSQKFGSPPLKELAADLTNWKSWKQAHPDTDVYLGPPAKE